MKHLLNTLYILSEDIYLSLDGENVVANRDKEPVGRFPLHTLQNIVVFSYAGASPALMGACAQRQIGLADRGGDVLHNILQLLFIIKYLIQLIQRPLLFYKYILRSIDHNLRNLRII